jgi:hypothetical protein
LILGWRLASLLEDPKRTELFLTQNMSLNPTGVRFLIHNTSFNKSRILSLLFANPNVSSIFLDSNVLSSQSAIPLTIHIPNHILTNSTILSRVERTIKIPILDSLFPYIMEMEQVGPSRKKTPVLREGLIYHVLRNESFNSSLLQQFTRNTLPSGSVEELAIVLKASLNSYL